MAPAKSWKGARVLVTGAGGFIGSHLTEELLKRGAQVRALVRYNSSGNQGFLEKMPPALRKRLEVRAGDICDAPFVEELVKGQDAVFHLAALIAIPYSYTAPASFVQVNVGGTLNMLQACLKAKTRKLVVTSTSETFGTARYTPMDEAHPLQGQSPYAASKIGADALADSFYRSFGLPVAVARPFNTYGPRQSARAVLPTIAAQAVSGASTIKLGSTSPVRDFNFVADTVEGFLAVAASSKSVGEHFNLGSGRGVTVGQAAAEILKLAGSRAKIITDTSRVRPDKSEVHKLICSSRKANRLLGWAPKTTLDQGLAALVGYVRAHRADFKPELYNL